MTFQLCSCSDIDACPRWLELGKTLTLRFVMLDRWFASTEELAGMDMLCSDKTGTRTQNIMTIESKLLWCETSEQGLSLQFALLATEWFEGEKAESKAAAVIAVASNENARATFEGQNSACVAESDVAKETTPAMAEVAKETDEPDICQLVAECHLVAWLYERRRVAREMSSGPCRAEEKTPMSVS